MLKWDIYQLNQDRARNDKDPNQAIDKTKDRRYYVVLSPTPFNKNSKNVVAIPIQTNAGALGTCVPIPGGAGSTAKIPYDSHVHCYSIYNLEKADFDTRKIGHVGKKEQGLINLALVDFFELWSIISPAED